MDIQQVKDREGTWYHIAGSNAEVSIRRATPKQLREYVRRFSHKIKVKGTITEDYNWDQISSAMLQETIVEWKNIEQDDAPLPVTSENRLMLFDIWPEFNALCTAVWNASQQTEAAERDADLGNSSSGRDSISPATDD